AARSKPPSRPGRTGAPTWRAFTRRGGAERSPAVVRTATIADGVRRAPQPRAVPRRAVPRAWAVVPAVVRDRGGRGHVAGGRPRRGVDRPVRQPRFRDLVGVPSPHRSGLPR